LPVDADGNPVVPADVASGKAAETTLYNALLLNGASCGRCSAILLGSGSTYTPQIPDGTSLTQIQTARTCVACGAINAVKDWKALQTPYGQAGGAPARPASPAQLAFEKERRRAALAAGGGSPAADAARAYASRQALAFEKERRHAARAAGGRAPASDAAHAYASRQARAQSSRTLAHALAIQKGKSLLIAYTVMVAISMTLNVFGQGPWRLIAVAIWVPLVIAMWSGKQGARIALGIWGIISIALVVIAALWLLHQVSRYWWLTLPSTFWPMLIIGLGLDGFGVYVLFGSEDVKAFIDEQY
jgi:hypothetical protein